MQRPKGLARHDVLALGVAEGPVRLTNQLHRGEPLQTGPRAARMLTGRAHAHVMLSGPSHLSVPFHALISLIDRNLLQGIVTYPAL